MSVYVDDLVDYGVKYGNAGPEWCHCIADTLEELHSFATVQLGLRREWFQDKRIPHYDLTKGKRAQAIKKGALQNPESYERCLKMWAEIYRRKQMELKLKKVELDNRPLSPEETAAYEEVDRLFQEGLAKAKLDGTEAQFLEDNK